MTETQPDVKPRPGDFFVTEGYAPTSEGIRWAENLAIKLGNQGRKLAQGYRSRWTHAGMCSGYDGAQVLIVEATPHGIVQVPFHYHHQPYAWSTGKIPSCPKAGLAVQAFVGRDYSFLDYAAQTAFTFHIPAPGLTDFIKSTGHMICSQTVAEARIQGFCPLWTRGPKQWSGYVMPADLGELIGQ